MVCHAGCTSVEICEAVGIEQKDCFAKKKGAKNKAKPTTNSNGAAAQAEEAEDESAACPYKANGAGLVWLKRVFDREAHDWKDVCVPLTNFYAEITGDVSRDDGAEQTRLFEIDASFAGESASYKGKVNATEFDSLRWASDTLGARAVVFPAKREHTATAIRLLSNNIKNRRVVAHTGWRFDGGHALYYHAGGAIGADGLIAAEVDLPPQLQPRDLPQPPGGERLKKVIRAVAFDLTGVVPESVALPLVGCGFASVVSEPDFSGFVVGPTGSGKSELAALIQSFFGNGFSAKSLPGSWSSSANSLEALAHTAKDCVLVVDDFCPTGSTQEQARLHAAADRVHRAQGNHSGRMRCRADGTVRPPKPPRGLAISTGEDLPRGHSLRARLAVIQVEKDAVRWARLTTCQAQAREGFYAEMMAAFLRWLATDNRVGNLRAKTPGEIGNLREEWLSSGVNAHKRSATTLAYLERAWAVWLVFAGECGALDGDEVAGLREAVKIALDALGRVQERYHPSENPAIRFMELIQAGLVSGKAHLAATDDGRPDKCESWGWRADGPENEYRPLGDRIGWVEDGSVYLHPDAAYKAAQAVGSNGEGLTVTAKTLWKRLQEAGDQRFLESWQGYLARTGDEARIGRFRLRNLRVVYTSYGICPAPQAMKAGGLD